MRDPERQTPRAPAGAGAGGGAAWLLVDEGAVCRWASDGALAWLGVDRASLVGRPAAALSGHDRVDGAAATRVDEALWLWPLGDGLALPQRNPRERGRGAADGGEPWGGPQAASDADRLAALLRHELSAPLAAALTQLRILQRGVERADPSEGTRESLALAMRQIAELRSGLETTVALHYGGAITLRPALIDLGRLIEDVAAREVAMDPEIACRLSFPRQDGGRRRLIGSWDPWAVRQVAEALLSAAILPTRRDRVFVSVLPVASAALLTVASTSAAFAAVDGPQNERDPRLFMARRLAAAHGGGLELTGEIGGRAVAVAHLPEGPAGAAAEDGAAAPGP